jgi:radical SAM protein with 4Fe4S-binding SPASM domain
MAEKERVSGGEPAGRAVPWPHPPLTAAVELTLRCNARCVHCGSAAGRPREGEFGLAEWKAVFRDLAALGGREVCLLGGEPFLVPWWEEAAASAGEAGLGVVFITNGALVDRDTAARLKRLPGLSRVAVSLDGASPETHDGIRGRPGSFLEAAGALERLLEAGVEAGAITTVMKPNLEELPRIRDLLLGRGIGWQVQVAGSGGARFRPDWFLDEAGFYRVGETLDSWRREHTVKELPFAGSHDIGYFSDRLRDYGERPQVLWRGCPAGLDVVGIQSDGGVKACLSLPGRLVEANVRERPLAEIWRDPTLFARNRRFRVEDLRGFCRSCDVAPECRGGCQEMCWSTTGTPWENRFCFRRIEREGSARVGE